MFEQFGFGEQKINIWWSPPQLCIWIVTNPTFDHYTDIWHLKTITNIDIWTAINGNGGIRNHRFLTLLVVANFPASVFTENSHNLRELQKVIFYTKQMFLFKKWPEKLQRYAPTKGNQEKTES